MARKKESSSSKKKSPTKPPLALNLSPALKEQIAGIALLALALVTLLSLLPGDQGALTGPLLDGIRFVVGWGLVLAPIWLGAAGLFLVLDSLDKRPQIGLERPLGALLLFLVVLAFLHLLAPQFATFVTEDERVMNGGGWLGAAIASGVNLFGEAAAYVILAALAMAGVIMLLNVSLLGLMLKQVALGIARLRGQQIPGVKVNGRAARRAPLSPAALTTSPTQAQTGASESKATAPARAAERRAQAEPLPQRGDAALPPMKARIIGEEQHAWSLPNYDSLLNANADLELSQSEIRERVKVIEETLKHFGVPARVVEVSQGPTVTQFGVEPGFVERKTADGTSKPVKVKVAAIAGLSNDLALALAAAPIRIEAPIPGRAMVGIEVPNAQTSLVSLRSVLESEAYRKVNSKLRIALGQDVAGQPIVADLSVMPHLLIAGATGSGKSVCINAVVACLLVNNTPQDLNLVMVDPKMVELVAFNGIPHLVMPVITDLDKVVSALQWAMSEMDRRYRLFAKTGVRNLEGYNVYAAERGEPKVPVLVIIIDELADLMLNRPEEAERTICRLAQMARATGIHLILATQRPSVDVVTGLIKANFPARIAFAVTTQVDSRVILDTAGAEKLLGRGDMLYMASDSSKLVRLQGCFVSDEELHRLVRHWRLAAAPAGAQPAAGDEDETPPVAGTAASRQAWEDVLARQKQGDGQDELLDKAIEVVQAHDRASVSLLQRRLRIGYSRAARLIDLMEEQGVVGPPEEAGRWRKVLVKGSAAGAAQREWEEEEEE